LASSDLIAAIQRRSKTLIVLSTLAVLAAVAALQVADLWALRRQTLKAAERRAENAAEVLAAYVAGAFGVADAALGQLSVHSRQMGGASAVPGTWDPLLESARAATPGLGSISVADTNGIIRHSTMRALIGQSRREQYLVRHLTSNATDAFTIDTPFNVPGTDRYVLPIGRRLTKADGSFDGVIVTTVSPEAYRAFVRTVDVGAAGSVTVFHREGVVVFREPSGTAATGESAKENPLFLTASRAGGKGVFQGELVPGRGVSVSAFHTIETAPLVVAVSLDRDEVLADWRRQRRSATIAFASLTLTVAGIVFVLFRQMTARSRIENELAEMQRLESARLRDANERLEQALAREQQARRESEAASYLKDEFLMTVSHELRTPLTAIFGWVRMLSTGAVPPEERSRALAAVERNARAQTRLIEDLLDVSRAISGKLRIDARGIDLSEVITAAIETVGPALRARRIRFASSIDPDLPQIVADPDRVQQIVWNLLSNAIKFTPEEGNVSLQVVRAGAAVEIIVRDSGVGISAEFLPHVFERFRQAEGGTRRRHGGLGLGLAIVRHLAELHGGSVGVESAGEGQGATFTVRLPIRAAAPRPEPERHPPASVRTLPAPARLDGIRVLVVDDDDDARELFASIVEAAGAEVLTAASVPDALRLLRRERDLVLVSDIEMPGEDGYQLLSRALAESGGARRLIAIAVTAYARTVDRQRALDAGFDAHLAKPVDPGELVATIASLTVARVTP
jgi:signal transduction histidine kinase/CheY-like chemotaxis protein